MNILAKVSIAALVLAMPAIAQEATGGQPRAAGDTPVMVILENEVFVRGPQVRLGEVARIEGEETDDLANLEIVPAPLPGSSTRVQAALIETRIRDAGLANRHVELRGASTVEATTLHQEIVSEQFAEDLRSFVMLEMPWNPAEATVDIVPPSYSVIVPDGEIAIEWRANPNYEYLGNGAFRGEVYVDGALKKTVQARATIEAYGPVVVAARDIPRKSKIAESDLAIEKRALSRMVPGTVRDPSEILGQVARSTIFPGAVITTRQVEPPILVRRHQVVTVLARSGGLEVRTRARCNDNGSAGDLVTCMNLDNRETYQGIVRKDGVVEVR